MPIWPEYVEPCGSFGDHGVIVARFVEDERKEVTMSPDIVEALLYAALAIVHFFRALSGAE